MADEKRRGLGRGLSALLGEPDPATKAPMRPRSLPVAFLKPNRFQPRRAFRKEDLNELADSIKEKGILQPIVVRSSADADMYEIVAGERRWRAAQLAKLHEVPVTVREFTDAEALEIAIIENVQRTDLNAIEEAGAYRQLMSRFGYTQEQLSDVIGKSRSHIANTLRLMNLPESVQVLVIEGKLTAGHARTLVGRPDAKERAQDIVAGALNVRQAELRMKPKGAGKPKVSAATKDADTKALEQNISNALGMTVEILHKGEKGGEVRIHYKNLEQLDDIMQRLSSFIEAN